MVPKGHYWLLTEKTDNYSDLYRGGKSGHQPRNCVASVRVNDPPQ